MNAQPSFAIGSDHAGFTYKEAIREHLREAGYEVIDYGTFSDESVDYPDFVHPVANSVTKGETELGILICGSANGVCMTANKHPKVRAAIAWAKELAELARQHNNANAICIPARFVSLEAAIEIVDVFAKTKFEGGRHERRVQKIALTDAIA